MVYAGGHISGGHDNPAVSLAVWIRGRLASRDLLLYWTAQLAGALLGAVLAHFLIDTRGHATRGHATTPTGRDAAVVLLAEFLFTFLLGYVVLNVATSRDNEHNGFYGVAVGTTVMAGVIAVGPLTGGAFNPALVASGWIIGLFSGSGIWLYLLATLLAGAAAGGAFRLLNPEDVGPARSNRSAPARGASEIA